MVASTTLQNEETLKSRASRWSRALNDSATGPLVIAREVVTVADEWSAFSEEETGALSANQWIRKHLHKSGLGYFKSRADAVDKLKSPNGFHHEVAVWLVGQFVSEAELEKAKFAVLSGRNRNAGKRVLTLAQARRVVYEAMGMQPQRKEPAVCERCAILEKVMLEKGVPVPS